MVFISGPRQAGKTTLAKHICVKTGDEKSVVQLEEKLSLQDETQGLIPESSKQKGLHILLAEDNEMNPLAGSHLGPGSNFVHLAGGATKKSNLRKYETI